MKAVITIVTADDEFTHEQLCFMKRMVGCLIEHHRLSASLKVKGKKGKKVESKNERLTVLRKVAS